VSVSSKFIEEEGLLTLVEAAKFLKISERTLLDISEPRGHLAVVRQGRRCKRYSPEAIRRYIQECQSRKPEATK
jgi:hypothetical protein